MTPAPRTAPWRLLPLAAAVAFTTACASTAPTTVEPAFTQPGATTTVGVADTALGAVLVGEGGRTLYLFDPAADGNACDDACLLAWPPYIATGVPAPATGTLNALDVAELGTVQRPDGRLQVTYQGLPLHFHGTDAPGQTASAGAEEFGGTWNPVSPAGTPVVR